MRTNRPDVGFLGAPIETDLGRLEPGIAVLGVPFGRPYPSPGATVGCADAPAAIRNRAAGLARFLDHWDFDADAPMRPRPFTDAGDVPGAADDGPGNSARTTEAVAAVLDRGAMPICLGGDDSVPIPILRAFANRGPLTILQVDAHLDFRDEVDGVREGYSSPMRRASEMDHVARIVQVGLRGVGSARGEDVEAARAAGNLLITARDVRERGIAWVLEHVPADASVFVSFDCDGMDPSVMPAVSALTPGGLTYPEAWDLLRDLRQRVVGAVFTELVPDRDVNQLSALTVTRLIGCLLGGA